MDIDRAELEQLKLSGLTYRELGRRYGVSGQRIVQLLRPPVPIMRLLIARAEGCCESCGTEHAGSIHHVQHTASGYNDLENLRLLCIHCHARINTQVGNITAKQVKTLRVTLGLTQLAFAEKLRTNGHTVSRWERDEARPTAISQRRIEALARRHSVKL